MHTVTKLLTAALLLFTFSAFSQTPQKERIRLFLDCSNTWCDQTFIKTEINLVDFVLDNKAADVHALITTQGTGNGGSRYQLIFFGQNAYKNLRDTLHFNTDPNNTEFETRNLLIRYLQLGLVPYLVRTEGARHITIGLKQADTAGAAPVAQTNDPWNYWVMQVGANGNFSGGQIYKESRYNGRFSVNRITDKLKVTFSLNGGKDKTTFNIEGVPPYSVNNTRLNFYHLFVKSINDHWSYGYDVSAFRSTFSNYRHSVAFSPAVEYNIFPYKDVNNRYFTLRYGLDVRNNAYFEKTLYQKTRETLYGHGLNASLSFNQKWGTTAFGLSYHNYFHNWKYLNLGLNSSINVRITGGLSFNFYVYGALERDQLFISGEGVTERDVLSRRRQLASSYYYYTGFGLNYRFGSKLSNFVNPRFEGSNGGMFFF